MEQKQLVGGVDMTSRGDCVCGHVEGQAIMEGGTEWISADNHGRDDHSGGAMSFSIGQGD